MTQAVEQFKSDLLYAYHDWLQENKPKLTMQVLMEYEQEIELEMEHEREMNEIMECYNQWDSEWGKL